MLTKLEQTEDSYESPIFLKLQKGIRSRVPQEFWVVEGLNFTNKFLDYQDACITKANASGYILENNVHEVLMLSSILLVKPHQHPPTLLSHFSQNELNILRSTLLNDACNRNHIDIEVDNNVDVKMKKIVKVMNQGSPQNRRHH